MKTRFLDSRDVESLDDALETKAIRSWELDVATAFLTIAGAKQLDLLAKRLARPKRQQQVRVLVGLWMSITEPRALEFLRKRSSHIKLRLAKTPGFHVKHYVFRGKSHVSTFTGSANLTAKGLGGVGELVAEVADKPKSLFASHERDVFRHLWEDTYPDELTDKIIAEYKRAWNPPKRRDSWDRAAESLLKKFGKQANAVVGTVKTDGSALWVPASGNLSEATVAALNRESPPSQVRLDFQGLGEKGLYERVRSGTREVWSLDLRGGPENRTLMHHRVLREVELPTEHDGRYFLVMAPADMKINLANRTNRERLRELGLVKRIDSLSSTTKVLRSGVLAKLRAMAKPCGKLSRDSNADKS